MKTSRKLSGFLIYTYLKARPAKLNEKKGDRHLEREINNKGDIFCWKNKMEIP